MVDEIKVLREQLTRRIVIGCASPQGVTAGTQKSGGIPGANPVPLDKTQQDRCIDPADYFPPSPTPQRPGIP